MNVQVNGESDASAAREEARTERFVRAPTPVLALARTHAAELLDDLLGARVDAGDFAASNCAVARGLGVSEKQIRQWRTGAKPLPFGAVFAFRAPVALDLLRAAIQRVTRAAPDDRPVESRLRRLSALVGELHHIVDDVGPTPLSLSIRRALRLRLARLIDEAERLSQQLSEDPSC